MLWALYAFFHSFARAAFIESGRLFKFDSWKLAFWQAAFGVLLLCAFLPMMSWPDSPHFYMAAIGVSMIFTVGMLIQLGLTAKKKGRVSSIYMPLETLAAIVIWIILIPSLQKAHMQDLVMTGTIAVAFAMAMVGLLKLRPNDVNLKTFLIVAPVGVTYAVAGIVTKLVIPVEEIVPVALAFTMINFLVMTVIMGLVAVLKRQKLFDTPPTQLLQGGVMAGFFAAMGYGTFVLGVAHAPNPGYVSFIAMLLPVWLMLYHGVTKTKDDTNAKAAIVIVVAILLLLVKGIG